VGNYDDGVAKPLSKIQGRLIGEDLLPAVKAAMLEQTVFQKLFGSVEKPGERIFVDELPSYNDTIVPLIELHWKNERWQSHDTLITGTLIGMIVLPADLMGRTDRFRAIGAAFARWIESSHGLFAASSGLREFGTNLQIGYDNAIKAGGDTYPVIDLVIPVVFDLNIFRAENPDADLDGVLDADLLGWIETYKIRMKDEDGTVRIDTKILSKTGQTNNGD
jgi:hypothetical protein